jgi:(p)ppGpp synthase/HD superfamily hydrolase
VHRAHVLAAVVHPARSDSDKSKTACPLQQLEESAIIVARLGLSAEVVAAALLQDAYEHEGLTDAVLTKYMPEEVVQLVAGLAQARTLSGLYHQHPGLREEVSSAPLRDACLHRSRAECAGTLLLL